MKDIRFRYDWKVSVGWTRGLFKAPYICSGLVNRRLVANPNLLSQSISPYDWRDSDGTVYHDPYRIGPGLVVRGRHWLSVTSPGRAARMYRRLQVIALGNSSNQIRPEGHLDHVYLTFTLRI